MQAEFTTQQQMVCTRARAKREQSSQVCAPKKKSSPRVHRGDDHTSSLIRVHAPPTEGKKRETRNSTRNTKKTFFPPPGAATETRVNQKIPASSAITKNINA